MAKKGPKPREWTDEERLVVKWMSVAGIPQKRIAATLHTTEETLEKYFRVELDEAADKCNSAVVGALYKNALSGNVTAQIFWCKTRLGWREVQEIEHKGDLQFNVIFGTSGSTPKPAS